MALGPFFEIEILDTAAEECFDRILRLAGGLIPSPVALFSLIDYDNDRQFFKSARGLSEPWAELRQTPLSHSFCRVVKEKAALLIVPDSLVDPMFCDNPAITDLGVRAYLGAPVRNAEQEAIGAVCVIDSQPRSWTDQDCEHIRILADIASSEIGLREETSRLQEAKRVASLGSWSVDPNGKLYWSKEVFEIFGASKENFDHTSASFYQFLHPSDVARVTFETELALQGFERYETVHAIIRGDGVERIVKENATVIRSKTGATLRLSGTVQDITGHAASGEALRQARGLESKSQMNWEWSMEY